MRRAEREAGERMASSVAKAAGAIIGGYGGGRLLYGRKLGPAPVALIAGGVALGLEMTGLLEFDGVGGVLVDTGLETCKAAGTGELYVIGATHAGKIQAV